MPKKDRLTLQRLIVRGFPFQYLLFTILPLSSLLLVVAFGSLSLHRQEMRSMVGDRDLIAARAAANSLNQALMDRTEGIQVLSEWISIEPQQADALLHSAHLADRFDRGLALVSAGEGWKAAGPGTEDWPTEAPEFQAALAVFRAGPVGEPAFSGPIPLAGSHPAESIMLAGVLLPNREVLIGAFTPKALIQAGLAGVSEGTHVTVYVADSQGQILYRVGHLAASEDLATHPGIAEALRGETGINYYQAPEGEHVVAFSPVGTSGWALVLEESWEMIASPLLNTTQAAPLILVPVLVLALIALWFATRRIVQPLQQLERRTAALAEGNYEAIQEPVGGILEIQHLQSELADMAGKLNAAQESLHRYIGAITAGVENERRSLARELHDDTIQALIALNQRVQLVRLGSKDAALQARMSELQELVQQTVENLRRMIRGLRPIYLEDLGLAAALEMLSREVGQAAGLPVRFEAVGTEQRLAPETELAFYRMAQEALNNVVRHAGASQAWLEIAFQAGEVRLEVRDNGKGFHAGPPSGDLEQLEHFGLLGLKERAELIHAHLQVLSAPGQGTTVRVRVAEPASRKGP